MKDGDQHTECKNCEKRNPFIPRPVDGYTAREIATLQARLDQQLGPEFIAQRSSGGAGKLSYIEAFKVIRLANEVFGFNGWSHSVQSITVDFVDEKPDNRFNVGLTVIVRVTLRDGTYHEDVGYGSIENCRGKGAAFEKCKKEGTTDAMKRALRNFGNVLGNCLYDKQFLKEVSKMKVPTARFDPDLLYRTAENALPANHPKMQGRIDMSAPVIARRATYTEGVTSNTLRHEDSYGDDLFDDEFEEDRLDNYDNVLLDTTLDAEHVAGPNNYHPPSEFINQQPKPQPQQSGPRQATITQQEAKRLHAERQAKDKELQDAAHPETRPPPPPFLGTLPDIVHPEIQGTSDPPPDYQPSFMNSRSLVLPTLPPAPFDPKAGSPVIAKSNIDHSKSTPIKRPGATPVESPVNASPLRRMGNQITAPGITTRSTSFRAPSKLNPTSAKRTSEVLAPHPPGSIALNQDEKRARV